MRKGLILNFNHLKIIDYVNVNKILIALSVIFIIGLTLGTFVLSDNSLLSNTTESYLKEYIFLQQNNDFFKKFLYCLLKYIFVLMLYFISGTTLFGIAVTPFITLWQGIWFGSIISYLYSTYNLSGIAFNAIILIPTAVINIICCFFAAKYSIELSLTTAKLTLPQSKPTNLFIHFKDYCIKYIVFVGVLLFCTLFEIVLNSLFLKYFKF